MAKQPSISNAAAIAACNAIVDLLDESGGDQGKIRIYDGVQPADVDTPVATQKLLAELTLSNPAFGNAIDATPGATALGNAITDDSFADDTGTATWFRCVTKSGVAVIDGNVGTVDEDMIVDSTSIQQGQTVQIISFKYTVRET